MSSTEGVSCVLEDFVPWLQLWVFGASGFTAAMQLLMLEELLLLSWTAATQAAKGTVYLALTEEELQRTIETLSCRYFYHSISVIMFLEDIFFLLWFCEVMRSWSLDLSEEDHFIQGPQEGQNDQLGEVYRIHIFVIFPSPNMEGGTLVWLIIIQAYEVDTVGNISPLIQIFIGPGR
ncbi:hypothetical protein RIF29_37264 [Crotalaria pallida]|uniref:Uncharacterized protein n=1 Tax=Crotalaria pallida TaxID=3830 RepID=A0AAN9ED34_CROPI